MRPKIAYLLLKWSIQDEFLCWTLLKLVLLWNGHTFLPLKWSIQDEVLCWTLPKLVIKHWSLSSKLNYRIIHHRISSRTKILCCTLLFTAKMFRSIYGQYILSGIYGRFILSGIYGIILIWFRGRQTFIFLLECSLVQGEQNPLSLPSPESNQDDAIYSA